MLPNKHLPFALSTCTPAHITAKEEERARAVVESKFHFFFGGIWTAVTLWHRIFRFQTSNGLEVICVCGSKGLWKPQLQSSHTYVLVLKNIYPQKSIAISWWDSSDLLCALDLATNEQKHMFSWHKLLFFCKTSPKIWGSKSVCTHVKYFLMHSIWSNMQQNLNKHNKLCGTEMWPDGGSSVCFPVDWAGAQESSLRLLHTWLEDGGRWSGWWRVSTQFHDGFREEASQAFQVAEQWEGSSVEESR